MNLYLILEGEKTEMMVYPAWINHILPHFAKVDLVQDVSVNNFYVFSGGGIPSIYNHVVNAIKDINDNPVFDKLIVCLDGEELGVAQRTKKLIDHITESGTKLTQSCELHVIIQNSCIETWFLGNKRIVKKNPEGKVIRDFMAHYNVAVADPENMMKLSGFRNKAEFHYAYFREILKEHNLVYRKSQPQIVMEESYFNELEKRVLGTGHLNSFKDFLDLLEKIKVSTS